MGTAGAIMDFWVEVPDDDEVNSSLSMAVFSMVAMRRVAIVTAFEKMRK